MIEKKVGIGEVQVEQGEVMLSAYGIGSCVVILLYEPEVKIGGLAHIMLPFGNNECPRYPKGALSKMLKKMSELGVRHDKIAAKIVGGASIFEGFKRHEIGRQNVLRTKEELNKLRIPIIAEDVFGNWGRSVFFNLTNGEVLVRSFKHGNRIL